VKVVWAPLALERVEEAFTYIAADRPSAAVKYRAA
jgi:plasmid stabilization system protein ParE